MVLSLDSEAIIVIGQDISEKKINKDILQKIEDDLDHDEKISILFLMTDDFSNAFQEVYSLFKKMKNQKCSVLLEFVNNHPEKWKDKLMEALCIIQNRQVIRKLGVLYNNLELIYVPQHRLCARNVNPVAKCLYALCEALSEDTMKLFVQCVKRDLPEYTTDLEDRDYLELHMLYWMEKNYISIYSDGRRNLKNILCHLKKFEELELIYQDLKTCENHQNVLDTPNNYMNVPQSQTFSSTEAASSFNHSGEEDVKKIKTGLCVIISEMFFSGQQYETRFGTMADCRRLKETFTGFGFNVFVRENLKKQEMLEQMQNIPKDFGNDYDCIFVCILSHGCKGGIIASDEEEITIEMIEHKLCCTELKDVFKVVIIQACQGRATGQMKNELAVDGPTEPIVSDIMPYRNFCIFMSTMQGFVSVRHKEQGSWFIQEFCNTLQNGGTKLSFCQAVRRIIQLVEKKRGKMDGVDSIAQLPELRPCRLLTDFQLPEYRPHTL